MNLFTTEHFPPRWYCGTWFEWHGWLHIISDTLIWAAYMAIPLVLLFFIRKRDDIPFSKVVALFAAFIFVCGSGHLLEAIIFWHPIYYFAGTVKACTAIVSWITVGALIKLTPKLLTIPSTLESHKKLTATLKQMDRSNRMLTGFSSACAHHLKEPLRGIHNYSEIVLRSATQSLGAEEIRKLSTVSSLAQRLDALLTAMLRFSEVHDWKGVKSQEDLHSLIVKAIASVTIELERVGGKISILEPLPVAYCDAVLTKQLFATIFLYAISRARAEEKFWIRVEHVQDHPQLSRRSLNHLNKRLLLAIQDSGAGLGAEELDATMNLFGHHIEQKSHPKGGYVDFLGPSYAKALAEAQGEDLWIKSSLKGNTTIFVSFSTELVINEKGV